jgi:pimeloyl-ACP methyl ester carboxylesterase
MGYEQGVTPAPRELWLSAARAQYAAAPKAEVRLIEPSRHWVQHDAPQAFSQAVLGFLAQP